MRPGLAPGFVLFKRISVIDSSHRASRFSVFCMLGLFEGPDIRNYDFGVRGAGHFRVSANTRALGWDAGR